jgi:hypothetical protein
VARVFGAAPAAAFVVFLALALPGSAWGQSSLQEVTKTPTTLTSGWQSKLQGSVLDASTYIGSGSFYATGYRNPYASIALFARPTYQLGTRYKLSLNARIFLEEELTSPDSPTAQRFYPYDPWVWLAAGNLHTFERSKIRVGGVLRTILPLSPESRYQHMLFGAGAGLNVNRAFEFGAVNDEARKWTLALTYGTVFVKYVQTSNFRGNGPGDSSGCSAPGSASTGGAAAAGGEPGASDADRCGGPANTNFAMSHAFIAALSRGVWSFSATLLVSNTFKYAFPDDALTADNAALRGRSDSTWGILSASYQWRKHLGFSVGVSSLQPALDSRYRYPRFPFFDLSGGLNYNNFTQLFASVNGSL